jgi:hypothetical protein
VPAAVEPTRDTTTLSDLLHPLQPPKELSRETPTTNT